jgi:putative tryptophan/tyrosine transport system substrate-binding protein
VFPSVLHGQTQRRPYRVVILDDGPSTARGDQWAVFRRRLRELGLIEGANVFVEARYGDSVPDKYKALVAEVVETKPDVIVTPGTSATLIAMRATSSIPIIFTGAGDPLSTGLVKSLARPGGNVTGVSILAPETAQKGLELLHELAPSVRRVAYLTNATSQSAAMTFSRLEPKASAFGISIDMMHALGRPALEQAFGRIRRDRVQALLVSAIGAVLAHAEEIVEFAAREKLPVVYGRAEYVRAGGLVSYDIDRGAAQARGADFVLRVLNGAKPAELPVEQVSKFHIAINLKAARAQGLKIPDSLRLRADEVIE